MSHLKGQRVFLTGTGGWASGWRRPSPAVARVSA